MKKLVLALAMALALGVAAAPKAEAKEGAFSLGADLGLVMPSDNLDARFGWGIDARYGIMADWDLAFNALFSTSSGLAVNDFHVAGLYLYEGWSLGIKLGFTKVETQAVSIPVLGVTIAGASETEFSFGPTVAYMFDVGVDNLQIGPQGDFIISVGDVGITKFNLLLKALYTFN